MRRLLDRFVARWQRACTHPPNLVAADILEGGGDIEDDTGEQFCIAYCRRCGAYQFYWVEDDGGTIALEGEWRRPDATIGEWIHVRLPRPPLHERLYRPLRDRARDAARRV